MEELETVQETVTEVINSTDLTPVLDKLDDIIELLNNTNNLLQYLANQIFYFACISALVLIIYALNKFFDNFMRG